MAVSDLYALLDIMGFMYDATQHIAENTYTGLPVRRAFNIALAFTTNHTTNLTKSAV